MGKAQKIDYGKVLLTGEFINSTLSEVCRRSFFAFLKEFWGVIIMEELIFNWHIEYLCDELQLLSKSIVAREVKPYDILINIPPGTTKSTIALIMFPAWLWTQDASIRIITNSYSADLSIEHAVKSRDVIISEKYQRYFPEVIIRPDKFAKTSYENTKTGARYVTSTGGTITGKHAHVILNDDPLNPSQAASDVARKTANEHTKTLSTRKISKANTPTITIMQRLHENDPTGYLLAKKAAKIKHICLPAEASDDIKPVELRERYIDGLLDPVRLSREILEEAKVDLGSRAYAGQFEQSPTEDGGNIVKKEWFGHCSREDYRRMGNNQIVFFMDTAYTDKASNDPTGIIATCKINNDLYITGGKTVMLKFPDLIRWLPQWVGANGYSDSSSVRIEPKASGISIIQQLKEITHLNITNTETPTDSKETRLNACSPMIECGRVILVNDNWNEEFVEEVSGFPNKTHDEYVDLICYAIDYHLKPKKTPIDKKRLSQNIY